MGSREKVEKEIADRKNKFEAELLSIEKKMGNDPSYDPEKGENKGRRVVRERSRRSNEEDGGEFMGGRRVVERDEEEEKINDKDIKDDMYDSQREQLAKLMGGGEAKEDNHRARKRSENSEKELKDSMYNNQRDLLETLMAGGEGEEAPMEEENEE